MTDLESAIFTLLSNDTTVTAVVANRVWCNNSQANPQYPFILFRCAAAETNNRPLNGPVLIRQYDLTIDLVAKNISQVLPTLNYLIATYDQYQAGAIRAMFFEDRTEEPEEGNDNELFQHLISTWRVFG